ncbi:MAG: HAMP domain-containing sensor histidine kinase [Eubacteriales bacterium]|nr:HAMP domain-containing sensor histidine kinase [Eubacteriales bacterium]
MKNKYKRLKRTILIRTALAALIALAVGFGIVRFFIDGIFQDLFTNVMMWILTSMNLDHAQADELYGRIFMDNKYVFLVIGIFLLFFFLYNLQIKRLMHYLVTVEQAIDSLQGSDTEPVKLAPELKPISDKLTALKMTLRRKEAAGMQSEQRKNDLVVYLAHDLKTPLTSIIAYLTMLDGQKQMDAQEREKYTHVALEKATRLGELINEFFEITRFNLQDIVLEKERLNLSVMLEQLADESYGMLQDKFLSCHIEADDHLMVDGDPDKLARVFDNLLRNAIAYSYRDTTIRIEARQENGAIRISFANQGHQIPEQKLKTIFEKFYRVDNARSSQTGGAGLGLAIAKQIVELHNGRIEAFSDRTHTTFTVWLPGVDGEQLLQPVASKKVEKRKEPMPQEKSQVRIRRHARVQNKKPSSEHVEKNSSENADRTYGYTQNLQKYAKGWDVEYRNVHIGASDSGRKKRTEQRRARRR